MKSITLLRTLLLLVVCSVVFSSCFRQKPKITSINPAFGQYITGYTSGMVSRKTAIRVELAKSLSVKDRPLAAGTASLMSVDTVAIATVLPDNALLEDLFSFEPAIKGHAVWVNDRVVDFMPDEPLPVNTFYNVDFQLEKLFKVPGDLETFHFQFSTYPQNLFVNVDGLRTYDDYSIDYRKLSGLVSTSDYEDSLKVTQLLSVTENGRPRHVSWSKGYQNNEFYFYVDSVQSLEQAGKLVVEWKGEDIHAIQKGSQELMIPALGDFSVTEAKVENQEDQSILIYFSHPLQGSQNLKGIITLQGMENLTYDIAGNVVRVYLPNRLEGEHVLSVATGIKNCKGYKMNTAFTETLFFEEPKPMVRIHGSGCILPATNGMIFPFEAISLKAVDVRIIKIFENNVHQFLQTNNLDGNDELTRVGKVVKETTIRLDGEKARNLKQWNSFVLDLGKLISPDPGSIYRISIKYKKDYAICNCEGQGDEEAAAAPEEENGDAPEEMGEITTRMLRGTTVITEEEDRSWSEQDWQRYSFGGGYDTWYYYNNNDYSPCNDNYYYGNAVSRNILASDLGLIYKIDDNKLSHAFISNMLTAKPLPGATIEYYDYARQLIASGVSDANGMLDLPLKRKPFLMMAKYGKQRGYLKLRDGYNNSMSKFDVEGEVVQKGVKGFIYGERGVWRPGDSLYLNFILEDKENRLPAGHPVKFELMDPSGQVVYQVTKTKHVNGLYDFRTATSDEAPTGNYQAVVRVGNRSFTQSLKIETVKPNRLKIYLDFGKERIGTSKTDTSAKLQAKWLHGAVAKNLKATVNVSVNEMATQFEGYKNYVFDSPLRHFYSESEAVFDGTLNVNGEARIPTRLAVNRNAPGMLRANYTTRVFEEGGDFSIDRYSVVYSPYTNYIGLRTPEVKSFDDAYETGKTYVFDLASLNGDGRSVDLSKVQLKVYKIQWRWWYEREEEDLATYIARAGTIVEKDTILKTKDGKAQFRFKVDYPDYGRYLVTVTDLEGGHQTGKVVYIDWPYWSRANRSGNENASMLNFSCDKEKYRLGDKIKLSIPSPADGMALVSVESGTRVLKKFWINTVKGETQYEFPATADMSPNAYLHVTLLQPHATTKNDLPIRMYGVVPVIVDDPMTHLNPELRMPDVIKPEASTTIHVKEKNGRRMTYTLAMVDEGLLDLTRFRTPQPWNTFYAREALGVKTWDMYDAVIGAYAGKLDKLLSVGGDGDGMGAKGVKANRFKPMVKFMGPFTLEPGQERSHKIDVPNYVGSVRVMVVAENEGAYGQTDKTVAVRKPLMLLATLPRVLGPGEAVALPVDVFAMEQQVKDVHIEVQTNDLLSVEGSKQQSMNFSRIGDEVINFKLNVASRIGIARVKIIATSGKEKAVQEIELDVRAANPKVFEGIEKEIEPGASWDAALVMKGIPGTNKLTVEVSSIPPLGLEKRLDYLIHYPYGCIEQTTSSVFPQLFVNNLMELKQAQQREIAQNIKAGIKRLQLFQTAAGGFSYWPGEGYESEWGSNYAGHFLMEAEKQGYSLPQNMKSKWLKYQQQQARNWTPNNGNYSHPHGEETNEVIQAYRLFVLALGGNAELGAMNRLREEKDLSATAKWRLAAAYKLAGQNEVALALIKDLTVTVKPYKELSYSYGSDLRDKAMILETLSLLNDKLRATGLAKELINEMNKDQWMSTQETAYNLLALCAYTGAKGAAAPVKYSYALNGAASQSAGTMKVLHQLSIAEADLGQKATIRLKNEGGSTLYAKLLMEGVPLNDDKTASARDLAMSIRYTDMQGRDIKPEKLQQGTDFKAIVTLSNPGTKGQLKEMVLHQIFPSGWEIHNTRMDESGMPSQARYQDIRDDRVYSYYDLEVSTTKTIIVQLNATYLGRFYLPTLYSEAMYDHLIHARIPGRWVEVVKDGGVAGK